MATYEIHQRFTRLYGKFEAQRRCGVELAGVAVVEAGGVGPVADMLLAAEVAVLYFHFSILVEKRFRQL